MHIQIRIGLLIVMAVLAVFFINKIAKNNNSNEPHPTNKEKDLEFSMGDNLRVAVTQLALSFESFDKSMTNEEGWKEIFIAKFIQNSRVSFDYLDKVSDQSNGEISVSELNYIQYSLTAVEIDFSDYVNEYLINRNDSASGLNHGNIVSYDYEITSDGIIVVADFEVGFDGTDAKKERKLIVNLLKNPESCFDGYSIVSISSEEVTPNIEGDGMEHIFYGTDMMEEDNGIFPFEFSYSEDDMSYAHFVYVDMTSLPELATLVRNNPGCNYKITFILIDVDAETIGNVVPLNVSIE